MKAEENHCKICGKLIPRKQRADGRAESITQYMARKTCGRGTICARKWRSQFMQGNDYNRRGRLRLPDYEDRTAGHPWLYRPCL